MSDEMCECRACGRIHRKLANSVPEAIYKKGMIMHRTTYEYLKPTDEQIEKMSRVREAAKTYSEILERELPEGPDKTFVIRAHRSNAMWANVAITRLPDGTPRE
jgi:succinate dehydrogenase/fumarate reductase flavoprotein subunit